MVPETRAIDPAEGARVADPRAVRVSVGEDGVGVGGDEPDVPAIVVEPAQTLMPGSGADRRTVIVDGQPVALELRWLDPIRARLIQEGQDPGSLERSSQDTH